MCKENTEKIEAITSHLDAHIQHMQCKHHHLQNLVTLVEWPGSTHWMQLPDSDQPSSTHAHIKNHKIRVS
jgi:hypothetical protein